MVTLGWVAYLGVTGGFFTVIIRYLFPNVLFEPPQTFKIGFPEDFSSNSVDIKYKKEFNAWIVRDEESIFALSTVCTHLGCTQIGFQLNQSLNVLVMVVDLE